MFLKMSIKYIFHINYAKLVLLGVVCSSLGIWYLLQKNVQHFSPTWQYNLI